MLSNARFHGADLRGADFGDAHLFYAEFSPTTRFDRKTNFNWGTYMWGTSGLSANPTINAAQGIRSVIHCDTFLPRTASAGIEI